MSAVIRSRDNPLAKRFRRLGESARERRKQGLAVLDGAHLLEAWLQAGLPVTACLVAEGASAELRALLAAHPELPQTPVSASLLAELSPVDTPTGLLALGALPPAPGAADRGIDSLLLDGVQDPGNLGSLLRTASAAGFTQVLLSTDCAQAWSPRALRAGMGAQLSLQIHEGADLPGFLQSFAGSTLCTALDASASLYDCELAAPLAWVFGSEGQGVRAPVRAATQRSVRIPMAAGVESLNVAAAAAVCLFETLRRRQASGAGAASR